MSEGKADRSTILSQFKKEIANKLQIDEGEITEDSTLEGLGADSLESSEIVFDFQDEYKLPEDFEDKLPKSPEGEERTIMQYPIGELVDGAHKYQGTDT